MIKSRKINKSDVSESKTSQGAKKKKYKKSEINNEKKEDIKEEKREEKILDNCNEYH